MAAYSSWFRPTLIVIAAATLSALTVQASVVPIGSGDFPVTSTLETFAGLAETTEVNGLSVAGILFSYSAGNGNVVIDGGPGTTNNVEPPNVVSVGDASGVLTLTLPTFFDRFGFGYAILNTVAVPNAATITVFNGTTSVGILSYDGVPDPNFTGGFAGVRSTIPFNRVDIAFNSAAAPAFALDNVRLGAEIPEPSSLLLVFGGAAVLFWRSKRFGSRRTYSR